MCCWLNRLFSFDGGNACCTASVGCGCGCGGTSSSCSGGASRRGNNGGCGCSCGCDCDLSFQGVAVVNGEVYCLSGSCVDAYYARQYGLTCLLGGTRCCSGTTSRGGNGCGNCGCGCNDG